jgi:hypothetical protein
MVIHNTNTVESSLNKRTATLLATVKPHNWKSWMIQLTWPLDDIHKIKQDTVKNYLSLQEFEWRQIDRMIKQTCLESNTGRHPYLTLNQFHFLMPSKLDNIMQSQRPKNHCVSCAKLVSRIVKVMTNVLQDETRGFWWTLSLGSFLKREHHEMDSYSCFVYKIS